MRRATQEAIQCTQEFIYRMVQKGFSHQEVALIVLSEACPEMRGLFGDIEREVNDNEEN
jgi:hypothetical protein